MLRKACSNMVPGCQELGLSPCKPAGCPRVVARPLIIPGTSGFFTELICGFDSYGALGAAAGAGAPHHANYGAKSQEMWGQEVMCLFHGDPFNYPREANATGRGAPHGSTMDILVVNIC